MFLGQVETCPQELPSLGLLPKDDLSGRLLCGVDWGLLVRRWALVHSTPETSCSCLESHPTHTWLQAEPASVPEAPMAHRPLSFCSLPRTLRSTHPEEHASQAVSLVKRALYSGPGSLTSSSCSPSQPLSTLLRLHCPALQAELAVMPSSRLLQTPTGTGVRPWLPLGQGAAHHKGS